MKPRTLFQSLSINTVSEWDKFQRCGLLYDDQYFYEAEKVIGDGHCFFRSCVQSNKFGSHDHYSFREELMRRMEVEVITNTTIGKVICADFKQHNYGDNTTILEHIQNMKLGHRLGVAFRREWGTETEMVAITLIYKIRIFSINNTPFHKHFSHSDSVENAHRACRVAAIDELEHSLLMLTKDLPTINIFFHKCGSPMTPGKQDQLNHFCLLHLQDEVPVDRVLDNPPYRGIRVKASPAYHHPTVLENDPEEESELTITNSKRKYENDEKDQDHFTLSSSSSSVQEYSGIVENDHQAVKEAYCDNNENNQDCFTLSSSLTESLLKRKKFDDHKLMISDDESEYHTSCVSVVIQVFETLKHVNADIPYDSQDLSNLTYGPMVKHLNNKKITFSTLLASIKSGKHVGKRFVSYVMENDEVQNPKKYCISENDVCVHANILALSTLSSTWNPSMASLLIFVVEKKSGQCCYNKWVTTHTT